ncbi:hypothetical protein VTN96DRAFT_4230 [Rasamsonia emersonii]
MLQLNIPSWSHAGTASARAASVPRCETAGAGLLVIYRVTAREPVPQAAGECWLPAIQTRNPGLADGVRTSPACRDALQPVERRGGTVLAPEGVDHGIRFKERHLTSRLYKSQVRNRPTIQLNASRFSDIPSVMQYTCQGGTRSPAISPRIRQWSTLMIPRSS